MDGTVAGKIYQPFGTYYFLIICGFVAAFLSKRCVKSNRWVHPCIGILVGCVVALLPLDRKELEESPPKSVFLTYLYTPVLIAKNTYFLDTRIVMRASFFALILFAVLFVMSVFLGFMALTIISENTSLINIIIVAALFLPDDIYEGIKEVENVRNLNTILNLKSTLSVIVTIFIQTTFITDNTAFIERLEAMGYSSVVALLLGCLGALIIRLLYNDPINATITLFVISYASHAASVVFFRSPGELNSFLSMYLVTHMKHYMSPQANESINIFLENTTTTLYSFLVIYLSSHVMIGVFENCKFFDIFISIGLCLFTSVARLASLLLAAPCMARFAYGYNFVRLMITIKSPGPITLITTVAIIAAGKIRDIGESFRLHVLVYLALGHFINEQLRTYVMKNLSKLGPIKQNAVDGGVRIVTSKRNSTVTMLKTKKFLKSVNWKVVKEMTDIMHSTSCMYTFHMTGNKVRCANCDIYIKVEPTPKEFLLIEKEAMIRTLRAISMSFRKQNAIGFVSIEEMRMINQLIDNAYESKNMTVKLRDLVRMFLRRRTVKGLSIFKAYHDIYNYRVIPNNPFKRLCYLIMHDKIMVIAFYFCAFVQVGTLFFFVFHLEWIYYVLCCLLGYFVFDFVVKIVAWSGNGFFSAFSIYFSEIYNIFDFIALFCNILDVSFLTVVFVTRGHYHPPFFVFIRITRVASLMKLVWLEYVNLFKYMDKKADKEVMFIFSVCSAVLTSYEEVMGQLNSFVPHESIKQSIRNRLINDRLELLEMLGLLARDVPRVKPTHSTRLAKACTLWAMDKKVAHLRNLGLLDVTEFERLHKYINERFEAAATFKKAPMSLCSAPSIVAECPWLHGNKELSEFIVSNVVSKVLKKGEAIFQPGAIGDGIYFLIAGILKLTYEPSQKYLGHLRKTGELPVKDLLGNLSGADGDVDYICLGNSVGEMAVLTGRPSGCKIVAHTPSETLLIPRRVMEEAFKMNVDDVNGIVPKMWKYITRNLIKSILVDYKVFMESNFENIYEMLDRMIVPNLASFSYLATNSMIEEMVLLDGVICDIYTMTYYYAPCYIPRNVIKMKLVDVLPNVRTPIVRLAMLVTKSADVYEVMKTVCRMSEPVMSEVQSKRRKKHKHDELTLIESSFVFRNSLSINRFTANDVIGTNVSTQLWMI